MMVLAFLHRRDGMRSVIPSEARDLWHSYTEIPRRSAPRDDAGIVVGQCVEIPRRFAPRDDAGIVVGQCVKDPSSLRSSG